MSGIIGGAGSKSGIIGITELPENKTFSGIDSISGSGYEEGSFTLSPNTGSFTTVTAQTRYTRIGSYCHCNYSINNVASSAFSTLSGLPFTTRPAGTGYDSAVMSSMMMNGVDAVDATFGISMYVYNMTIYIYQAIDASGWLQMTDSHIGTGDDLQMAWSYHCQS
jgi:hypothetical protein